MVTPAAPRQARALDLVRYSDPADPRNPFTNSSGVLLRQLNIGAADSATLFGPICQRQGFTHAGLEALHRVIEARRCQGPGRGPGGVELAECTRADTFVFMRTQSNVTSRFVELTEAEVYVVSTQPATDITFSGVTITSAFKTRQTTVEFSSVLQGALCGQFLLLGRACAVLGLRFDQTKCRGTGAERVPVMFAGRSSEGAAVLGNTVVDAEGAAAFLGGEIEQTRYIDAKNLDVDRAVVGNTQYEYSDKYRGSRYIAAVFGSTLGAAVLSGAAGSPLELDARHAPQLDCFNATSGGAVCLRPGNAIVLAGERVQEMSICGTGCASPGFRLRGSRRDGLGCFSDAPITECQVGTPTPGVRAVPTCAQGPFGPGDDQVVDRYGLRCGWEFGNLQDKAPCSERTPVAAYTSTAGARCTDVQGAAELCGVLYDNETLQPCTYAIGDGTCSAFGLENSCNGFPVPVAEPPLSANPCDVYNDTDLVLRAASAALRQQWWVPRRAVPQMLPAGRSRALPGRVDNGSR